VLSPDEKWAAAIDERILADCHPFQREAVTDPSRRYSILVGRGGGKTTTFRARAARKMVSIRRADILYLALTEDHARELNWDPLQDMNEHYGLELRFNKSELTATCARTGSKYQMGGMENDQYIEQYRGKSRDELQVDETASQNQQRLARLLDAIVGPRMRKGGRQGCIGLGGTAGHELTGIFYDATRPGSAHHARYTDRSLPGYEPKYWSSHHWTNAAVYALPNARELYPEPFALWEEALIEKEKKGWSDDNPLWMREYLAIWASDLTGRVFQYRPTVHQWDPFDGQKLEGVPGLRVAIAKLAAMGIKDLHFVVAADGGHSDPFALNILAFSPTDPRRRIWHVCFLERTGWYAKLIAELIAGPESIERIQRGGLLEPLGGVLGVTSWPDASVMDTDGSTLAELKNVYGLAFKKADRERNAKKGKIELVNGEFHEERLYIIKNSPLEEQLGQLQWKEDINGQLKEDPRQANHSCDTLVYGRDEIAILFESGAVDQPAAAQSGRAIVGGLTPPTPPDPIPGIDTEPEFESLLTDVTFVDVWGNQ
jgi:hypothetical protein